MSSRFSHFSRSMLGLVLAGGVCVAWSSASAKEKTEEAPKPAFDAKSAVTDAELGMPSPYDKFLALDGMVKGKDIEWRKLFNNISVDIDADRFNDKESSIPMALGIRIVDGVMAIRAKDAELLNKCAADIEKLAKKLGIADADLARSREVRAAANRGAWLKVFMELSFLQQDIMKKIENKDNRDRGTLLIVSGWMQGARYTSAIVLDHYSKEASNVLREPMLGKALEAKLDGLPEALRKRPEVAAAQQSVTKLIKLIDIPLDGSIDKENVQEIQNISTGVVKTVLTQ